VKSHITTYLPVVFADGHCLIGSVVVTAVCVFKVTLKPDDAVTLSICQAGRMRTTKSNDGVVVADTVYAAANHLSTYVARVVGDNSATRATDVQCFLNNV